MAKGGNDTLTVTNAGLGSHAELYGDALQMQNNDQGGNDILTATDSGMGSSATLFGDANVFSLTAHGALMLRITVRSPITGKTSAGGASTGCSITSSSLTLSIRSDGGRIPSLDGAAPRCQRNQNKRSGSDSSESGSRCGRQSLPIRGPSRCVRLADRLTCSPGDEANRKRHPRARRILRNADTMAVTRPI